ncbi:NHLP bacteriocin system secretion protein [Roseofilum capinflatum]|uniref:NHLP bacteriocin system secretion protein n=1 Tax=Roseofilum capinflatum BLCC-M114 TaxID=3022440 RepID=A0ABT7B6W3_9CYAN|nr:NHLP bacteriocin system secretion protein [Roseofilum capinflatum]MDJ1174364.1 NHLP bacteriocin system secretion protein [Roseofilum capinflatum BLCC-M114]
MPSQEKDSKPSIFRQESLDQLSSPERLDQLMQVVSPKDWLPLTVLGSLVFIGLVWSVFGRIPITVQGKGILIDPRRIVDFQSPISGQLESLHVEPGECVEKNTLLATINPSELRNKLALAQTKKEELEDQYNQTALVLNQKNSRELEAIAASRASIQQRLRDTQAVTPLLKERGLDSIAEQRESLQEQLANTQNLSPILKDKVLEAIEEQRQSVQQRLDNARELAPVLEERLTKRQELVVEGAIEEDTVLDAQQSYIGALENISELEAQLKNLDVQEADARRQSVENLSQVSNLQAQIKALEVQETEAEKRYLDNLNEVGTLTADLEELDTREKRLEQETLEELNTKRNQIREVEREMIQLEQQIAEKSEILSPNSGCILETTATTGQVVSMGTRLGSMNMTGAEGKMIGITYFALRDGKKIQPGMPIQITPDIVKQQRYGGIVGTITSVSDFAVTEAGATTIVGNSDVVKGLISSGGVIEIRAELQENENNFSGYQWSSSQGPQLEVSPGTTATARVRVEERSPITFVLPILREWTGVY